MSSDKKRKQKSKKKSKKFVVITVIAAVLLAITLSLLFVIKHYTGGMTRVAVDAGAVGADTGKETENEEGTTDGIRNFMIFGVDTVGYTENDINRSDTNIIVSVNSTDKKINIIYVLRDTKAPIEGYEAQKINAAYQLGGYELALKTFNQCFKLGITDFITIDFAEMTALIDYIGGIDVGLSEDEAKRISNRTKTTVPAGVAHLNGEQALAYSRIRKLDTDYYRASRQQSVLQAIRTKVSNMSVTQYPDLIKTFLNTVTTTFSLGQLMGFLEDGILDYKTAFYTVPEKGYEHYTWVKRDEHGEAVFEYDLDAAAERINNIIYHDWTE